MKILLTGGSGRLGQELQKHLVFDAPSCKMLDITDPKTIKKFTKKPYDLIIHSAAYTDVAKAETDRQGCFEVNVVGTINLLKAFPNTPFVYISSEYAHSPINYYSETKALGEIVTEKLSKRHLIIRTLFKPNPWPFDKAFEDQYTQGDYIDVIAPLILEEIKYWDNRSSKLVYVGTGRKTMFELARRTKPDVIPNSIDDIEGVKIPNDYL